MDRVLQALLRTELRFFIRKVFTTVLPGETYLHNTGMWMRSPIS
jgi:hypothetical protein